jgi:hypothetical protein
MFRQVIDAGQIEGRNAVQIGLHGSLATVDQRDYASSVGLREIPAREVWQRGIERGNGPGRSRDRRHLRLL